MQIAAVAYERLTPAVRAEVDVLAGLTRNIRTGSLAIRRGTPHNTPLYEPRHGRRHLTLKRELHGQGRQVGQLQARQNHRRPRQPHAQVWYPSMTSVVSTDDTPLEDADPVNALTRFQGAAAGLAPSSGLRRRGPPVRIWSGSSTSSAMPISRSPRGAVFARLPHGDQGGNKEMVVSAPERLMRCHFYWDRLLRRSSARRRDSRFADQRDIKFPEPDSTLATNINPDAGSRKASGSLKPAPRRAGEIRRATPSTRSAVRDQCKERCPKSGGIGRSAPREPADAALKWRASPGERSETLTPAFPRMSLRLRGLLANPARPP